jgi:hypothetical protein
VQVKKIREREEICMGRERRIYYSCFCMQSNFYMQIFGQQESCRPMNNILCENCQEKKMFCCCVNSYGSCRIPKVPAEIFLVQPMLEVLEVSGKA